MPPEKLTDRCSESTADAAIKPQKRWDTDRGMSLQGGGKQCQNQQSGCPDSAFERHFS